MQMPVLCGTIFFRASAQNGGSVCLFTFVPAFLTLAQKYLADDGKKRIGKCADLQMSQQG